MKYLSVFLLIAFVLYLPTFSRTVSAAQICRYVVFAEQAPLYNAPLPHVSQQIGVLLQNGSYPILKQSGDVLYLDTPFLIEVSEDAEAWVSLGQGGLEGDCSQVEIDTTPATEYPAVCTFTTTGTDGVSEGMYEVTGFEDGRYSL
jgi:hypothetical protein